MINKHMPESNEATRERLLYDRYPMTWEEQLDERVRRDRESGAKEDVEKVKELGRNEAPTQSPRASRSTEAIRKQFQTGAIGELHSLTVDADRSANAFFTLGHATAFTNESYEWKQRLDALRDANRDLEAQIALGGEVQRALTVQLMHRLRQRMAVDTAQAMQDASTPVWKLCERKRALELKLDGGDV